MPTTTFKLKVLTPMFMGGADPQGEPELRAASIRGAMRFWFRAMAATVTDDPREIYRLESEIFGNTERKSRVVVRVKTKLTRRDWGKYKLLPHKNFTSLAISPHRIIDIELAVSYGNEEFVKLVLYSFWLSTALGGWGRRSRRGAGTVVIENVDGDFDFEKFKMFLKNPIKSQLNTVKNAFNRVFPDFKSPENLWPYILKVVEWKKIFSKSWGDNSPIYFMFKKTSKFIRENGDCLGQINPERYASPIVARVISKDNRYTLRFTVLQSSDHNCEKKINEFFEKIGNTEEVWHA